jgi:hypothetical protein
MMLIRQAPSRSERSKRKAIIPATMEWWLNKDLYTIQTKTNSK